MTAKLKGFIEVDGHLIKEGTVDYLNEVIWPTDSDAPIRTLVGLTSGRVFYIDQPLDWVLKVLNKEKL